MGAGSGAMREDDLSRLFTAMLQCEELAHKAGSEQEVLQAMCDAMVASPIFEVAWFGVPSDPQGRIRIIARSSGSDQFFQQLNEAFEQSGDGGQATTAPESGDPCWIPDILTASLPEAVRTALQQSGLTSLISIPMTLNDGRTGPFTIGYHDRGQVGQVVITILKQWLPMSLDVFRTGVEPRYSGMELKESELRQLLDAIPQHITLVNRFQRSIFCNRALIEYHDPAFELALKAGVFVIDSVHRDDFDHIVTAHAKGYPTGQPFELEMRLRRRDGQYRWFLSQVTPVRDSAGEIIAWTHTATDIDDRKRAEERTRKENIALREEINRASMFEEIVGHSAKLRTVIRDITRVAPADSTVLIMGETGTGKELVARAIHRRSTRASRAFVAVNCASIPASLIASELFGHEKGAFTGAIQQRLGRFELADGGTIFLDEVGDLPAEIQVSLLRILQERQFERLGGKRTISVDVRVIAATNRDLNDAVAEGTFRQDLFYRLSVFPINVPPLRERAEDIPVLVEYFMGRYASKMGKEVRRVKRDVLALFQSYSWPGNVRELQNVVERAVVISDGEELVIEEGWLRSEPRSRQAHSSMKTELIDQERKMIEAALQESRGRVSGPAGAAMKLGIPAPTLESKIRALGIRKSLFKSF